MAKNKIKYFLILIVIIFGVFFYYNRYTEVSLIEANSISDRNVTVTGIVYSFNYDEKSGDKKLKIFDGTNLLRAVIPESTRVGWIELKNDYTFKGKMRLNPEHKYNELVIKSVD